MKRILFLAAILISFKSFSQSKIYIRGDSIYLQSGVNAELILLNGSRTTNGFLYNKGGGRTEFRPGSVKIDDYTYIIGGDTLRIPPGGAETDPLSWNLLGNLGTGFSNFIGTRDNTSFRMRTDDIQRMIIDSLGHVSIGGGVPRAIFDIEVNESDGSSIYRNLDSTGFEGFVHYDSDNILSATFQHSNKAAASWPASTHIGARKYGESLHLLINDNAGAPGNTVSKLTIHSPSGYVGINDTLPSEQLHVHGKLKVDTIPTGSSSDSLLVSRNGVVYKILQSSVTSAETDPIVRAINGLVKSNGTVISAAVAGTDYEAALGNPGSNGYILSSTTGGVRSWVAPGSSVIPAQESQTASSTAVTFTVVTVPGTYGTYIIYRNGSRQRPTTDYTTSGNVVTGPAWQVNDNIAIEIK